MVRETWLQSQVAWLIGLEGRVFANGPGDLGSIPGRVIPKILKTVLDISLLNTQQYKVSIKGKFEQSRKGAAASPTPLCSSYWKGSFLIALYYSRQLYLLIPTILKLFKKSMVYSNKYLLF